MKMTGRVIQETMRVASILSFTFREAVEDVEYQGKQSRDITFLVCGCPSRGTAVCCLGMNWLGKDVFLTERAIE
jgi:hypothetical protein